MLLGAIWVLFISFMGIKHGLFAKLLHGVGVIVGVAGILTLFTGLSFLSDVSLFEVATAIFGLGQIVWFVLLGINLIRHHEEGAH